MKYLSTIRHQSRGFTIIEVLVAIAIIVTLASAVLFSVDQARGQARDNKRKADLKNLQLAIELYAQENGRFPTRGCGAGNNTWTSPGPGSGSITGGIYECDEYIAGLVPKYLERLPEDPSKEEELNRGYHYYVNAAGTQYKVMAYVSVEELTVNAKGDEWARRPASCTQPHESRTYAVYHDDDPGGTSGAECW